MSINTDKLCQQIKVDLETGTVVSDTHGEKRGIYQISTAVNGHPSWITRSQAIWYIPQLKKWGIGPLESFGSVMFGIWNKHESVSELPYEIKDWEYLSSLYGWQPETVNEISVTCIDRNFRD